MAGSASRQKIAIWLLSIIVLASVIVLAIWQIRPISEPGQLTLPDGTIVRIEAMTFGKEHSFSLDPIRDKLRRWLPKPCHRFLGKPVSSSKMQTGVDSLVIWVTRLDPAAGSTPQAEWHYMSDQHGCKFQSFYRNA